jgi:hypothetical protein
MISQDDIDAFEAMEKDIDSDFTIKQEHDGMEVIEFSNNVYVTDMSIQYGEQPQWMINW